MKLGPEWGLDLAATKNANFLKIYLTALEEACSAPPGPPGLAQPQRLLRRFGWMLGHGHENCGIWRAGRALALRPGAGSVAGRGAASRPHPAPVLLDAG